MNSESPKQNFFHLISDHLAYLLPGRLVVGVVDPDDMVHVGLLQGAVVKLPAWGRVKVL